jgi:hypothetical protein
MKIKDNMKFKVGDRVRAYMTYYVSIGVVKKITSTGKLVVVRDGSNGSFAYHPKQCRRLKPKKERRRIWVVGDLNDLFIVNLYNSPNSIEFVEVLPRRGKMEIRK